MEGPTSSINSRATAIKTILLAAWRVKLSDEEWESKIRKVLPRGVNGDVYDLADCLLKQALVGPVPNQLFISYLKHAVNCELVSHGAVLSSIAHQSTTIRASASYNPTRTSSVICLLEFLRTFRDKLSCQGTEIDCLNLCRSLSQLVYWLLRCVLQAIDSILGSLPTAVSSATFSSTSINNPPMSTNTVASNNSSNVNHLESILGIIDLCTEMINYFINRPFTKSLLFISKLEFHQEFDETLKTVQVIQQKLATSSISQSIQDKVQHFSILQQLNVVFNSREMHPSVIAAQQLRCLQQHRIRSTHVTSIGYQENKANLVHRDNGSISNYALFNSLYSLVAFDVILRPARSHELLAKQLAIITDFNSANTDVTYCELIRICMIGLIDTEGTPAKVKWAFFSYLKLPKLLLELNKVFRSSTKNQDISCPNDFIHDLKLAFDRLREYSPLLDEAEYKCNCDFFRCLVKELIKNDSNLIQLKNIELPIKRTPSNNNDSSVGGHLMLKTDPFVTSMLQTFNSEQDPYELFSLLSQFVSGKQFEFTLSCAASTGRLHLFIRKLVEYNELNRIPWNDAAKADPIQALIFDITFLILTYIAQQYGPEVIDSDQNTTFNKWFRDCYNQSTRVNCPQEMLKNSKPAVVDFLIQQIINPEGGGIQMLSIDWREVCQNLPKAIFEILSAWNQGALNDDDMKGIIDRTKSKMCFVAVVTATWLQCHIRTLNEQDKTKPLFFLQSLTRSSQHAKQNKQVTNDSSQKNESYSERSSLMCSIIRKIYFELVPKPSNFSSSSGGTTIQTNNTESDEFLDESAYQSINDKFISTLTTQEIFLANVKQCLSRGWIDHKSLNSLNSLFKMIGSECFTNLIVEQFLTSHESPSDLGRAVNITFGLFHLDIEACAFALLKDTIPSWLMGEKKQVLLNQPRAFALAHLAVMTIIEVYMTLKESQLRRDQSEDKKLNVNGVRQDSSLQKTILLDCNDLNALKRIKLSSETHEANLVDDDQDVAERLERLNTCIADLMRLFREIMSDSVISHRTLFPVLFLQQTVVCTREESIVITVHLQPEILLDIINLFSSELTFELVLAISNLSTTNSRRYAAKAMCQLAQVKGSKQSNQMFGPNSVGKTNLETPKQHLISQGVFNAAVGNGPSSSRGFGPTPMVIG